MRTRVSCPSARRYGAASAIRTRIVSVVDVQDTATARKELGRLPVAGNVRDEPLGDILGGD